MASSTGGSRLGVFRFATHTGEDQLDLGNEPWPEDPLADATGPVLTLRTPFGASHGILYNDERPTVSPSAPFRPDPMAGTIAVRFEAYDSGTTSMVLLIPRRVIYEYLQRAREGGSRYKDLKWGDWNRHRVLALNTASVLESSSPPRPFGSQFPILVREPGSRLFGRVIVLDLSWPLAQAAQRGVRRERERLTVLEELRGVVDHSSTLHINPPYIAIRGPRILMLRKDRIVNCGGPLLLVSATSVPFDGRC